MALFVKRLTLSNFRNYEKKTLEFCANLTLLVGPNAAGKTSAIEALQLLTTGRSFRKPAMVDLVRKGASSARVSLVAEGEERLIESELRVTAEGSRSFLLNNKEIRGKRDIAGNLPCVVFTPDDISIVKGSAEGRRAALDGLGDQLSRTFGSLRREYERALRQRNTLLRDGVNNASLEALDEMVADLGARLVHHRLRLVGRVEKTAIEAYKDLSSGEELSVQYTAPWLGQETFCTKTGEIREILLREIGRRADEETRRGVTLSGPHRDDIVLKVDGSEVRSFASQGQQRSVMLAWKMAELTVIEEVTGQVPLLLLDDVMSELDRPRREALAALVAGHTQTVVTTTNLQYFSSEFLKSAEVVTLP